MFRFWRYQHLKSIGICLYGRLTIGMPNEIQNSAGQPIDSRVVKFIGNLDDLDTELAEADKAFQISDDEGRRRLARIHYKLEGGFPAAR